MDIEDAASELESICRRSQKDLEKDELNTYVANVFPYVGELNRIIAVLKQEMPDSFHDTDAVSTPNIKGKSISPAYGKVLFSRTMTEVNLVSDRLSKRLRRMASAANDVSGFGTARISGSSESSSRSGGAPQTVGLHPEIVLVSGRLFKDGHYPQAIFEAFKAVNNFVKQKSRLSLDGKPLMSKAFSQTDPVIRLNKGKTQSDKDEQEGFMFLFMGAIVGIRNPKGHENSVLNDPYRALEYLCLASLLLRRAEEGTVTRARRSKKPGQ